MAMETSECGEMHGLPASRPRVIVVGNLTIDDVVLPDGATQMSSLGGNSLYTALGVRLWQPRTGLVTRRGEDFPQELTAALHALGIATKGVVDIPGPTVRNWIVYEPNGERHWLYRTPRERSREVAVQPGDLPVEWLEVEPPPVVHIAAMPLDAAEAIVDTLRRISPRAIITLDTHEDYVVDYRQRLRALVARVDAFLPSRSELADLVGYDDPRRALVSLTSLPTPVIVIKMGAEGALVWDKAKGTLHEAGVSRGPVVDVTGAGDAFCGGFAAGLSLGFSPVESAQRGTVAASYAVAGFGSMRLARVDPAEAQARMLTDPPVVHLLPAPTSLAQVEVPGADRGISSSVDVMREEIAMIPELMAEQLEMLAGPLRSLAYELNTGGMEHLYLVGCGDSAFAGAATALAFQKHTGIHAEGVLALTGNPDSPLASEATDVITLSVPTLGYSPGTSTYLAILGALLELAVVWGEVRGGDTTRAMTLLGHAPDLARQTLAEVNEPVHRLAERVAKHDWVTFLGGGPNLATAHFGAAKLFEGPQKLGVATNIEEWAHEEYFVSGAGTPVFLVAPSGASFDRATEILSELNFIGANVVFVSDTRPSLEPGTFIP